MASYPVTVFRWDDPGAPQIGNGRASDIINIWQKCLVDGYGDKDPLGWTRPFYDAPTQRAIFRNSVAAGGSGGYVQLQAASGIDADYQDMRMTPAKSFADGNIIQPGFFHTFRVQNLSGNNRLNKWMVIGTGSSFYFLIIPNNVPIFAGNWCPSMFVGDIFSRIPNDAGRFIVYANTTGNGNQSSTSFQSTLGIFANSESYLGSYGLNLRLYDSDNSNSWQDYRAVRTGPTTGTFVVASLSTLTQLFHPVALTTSSTYIGIQMSSDSEIALATKPAFRGYLPGLFTSLFPYPNNTPWPFVVDDTNFTYWILHAPSGAVSTFIQSDTWYDPFN
ncbi:hypothetical protein [Alishewanella jeotgali]|uniref:Uncharacterized protein n=1 Tax=Alishewanella jeotgali KCTC 22429 TaxID=1129374 RepID=H3ZIE6_9ALTE|nr:hypothetical protein [Alishewanella jeotgali]EHR39596.1 hypothetical protein AJE_15784 [Alishewanella jeotgali KCTC 22429]